jgi:hypothetical protein
MPEPSSIIDLFCLPVSLYTHQKNIFLLHSRKKIVYRLKNQPVASDMRTLRSALWAFGFS